MAANQLNEFGLSIRDMDTITGILSNYPEVERVNIFGSRAKGNYKAGSDIDLAIMNEGVSEKMVRKLNADLEESTLPYRVDIVNFPKSAHSDLISHIKRAGVVFYEKQ